MLLNQGGAISSMGSLEWPDSSQQQSVPDIYPQSPHPPRIEMESFGPVPLQNHRDYLRTIHLLRPHRRR